MIVSYLEKVAEDQQRFQDAEKLASWLKDLPEETLQRMASGEVKVGAFLRSVDHYGASDAKDWVGRFEGSPLAAEAIELERMFVNLDIQNLQQDQQEDAQRRAQRDTNDAMSAQFDQVRLQRKLLELRLAEWKNQQYAEVGKPMEPMPVVPPAVAEGMAAEQAPPPVEVPSEKQAMLRALQAPAAQEALQKVALNVGKEVFKFVKKNPRAAAAIAGGTVGAAGGAIAGGPNNRLGGALAGGMGGAGIGAGAMHVGTEMGQGKKIKDILGLAKKPGAVASDTVKSVAHAPSAAAAKVPAIAGTAARAKPALTGGAVAGGVSPAGLPARAGVSASPMGTPLLSAAPPATVASAPKIQHHTQVTGGEAPPSVAHFRAGGTPTGVHMVAPSPQSGIRLEPNPHAAQQHAAIQEAAGKGHLWSQEAAKGISQAVIARNIMKRGSVGSFLLNIVRSGRR